MTHKKLYTVMELPDDGYNYAKHCWRDCIYTETLREEFEKENEEAIWLESEDVFCAQAERNKWLFTEDGYCISENYDEVTEKYLKFIEDTLKGNELNETINQMFTTEGL